MGEDTTVKNPTSQNSENLGVTFFGGKVEGENFTTPEKIVPSPSDFRKKEKVFNVSRAFEGTSGEQGTIITDKRKSHPSIASVFVAAMNEWWVKNVKTFAQVTEKIEALKRVEAPPVVEDPNTRKDVIVAAAQFTTQAPRDDHHVVVEKFKTLSHDAERVIEESYPIKPSTLATKPAGEQIEKTLGEKEYAHTAVLMKKSLDVRETFVAPDKANDSHTHSEKQTIPPLVRTLPRAPEPIIIPRMDTKKESSFSKNQRFEIAPSITHDTKNSFKTTASTKHFPTQTFKAISDIPKPPMTESVAKPENKSEQKSVWSFLHTEKTPPKSFPHEPSEPVPNTPKPIPDIPKPIVLESKARLEQEQKTAWSFLHTEKNTPVQKAEVPVPPEKVRPAPVPVPQTFVKPQVPLPTPVQQPMQNTRTQFPQSEKVPLPYHTISSQSFPSEAVTDVPSPSLKFASLIIIIGVAAILGIGTGMYVVSRASSQNAPAPVTQKVPEGVSLFSSPATAVTIPLPQTSTALLQSVADALPNTKADITQFAFTTPTGPATTADIMNVLSPQASATFIRELANTMVIGSTRVEQPNPFLILKTKTFEVAFAGMLSWELTMSKDLAPLFGNPVKGTRVPAMDTNTTTTPHFTDAVQDNHSIRILYDETGTEKIIYAVVNQNTIVITTSTRALSAILHNLK